MKTMQYVTRVKVSNAFIGQPFKKTSKNLNAFQSHVPRHDRFTTRRDRFIWTDNQDPCPYIVVLLGLESIVPVLLQLVCLVTVRQSIARRCLIYAVVRVTAWNQSR